MGLGYQEGLAGVPRLMTVLILENNLMWSVRLRHGLVALGHDAKVVENVSAPFEPAQLAILNLGVESFATADVVARLKSAGCRVVAHAGHKESPLMSLGNELGCDQVVSNSTLTHKLAEIVAFPS